MWLEVFFYPAYFALNYSFTQGTAVPGFCAMAKQSLLIKSYSLSFQSLQHSQSGGQRLSLTALETVTA